MYVFSQWATRKPRLYDAYTNLTAIGILISDPKAVQIKVQVEDFFQGMFGGPGVGLKLKSPIIMNTAGLVFRTCFEDVRRVKNVSLGHLWAVSHQMFPCAKMFPLPHLESKVYIATVSEWGSESSKFCSFIYNTISK